jgi:hypothetical protein
LNMVQWFGNLPTQTKFDIIETQPHISTVCKSFRNMDVFKSLAIGTAFPAALYALERYSPSVHPRYMYSITN